MPEFRSGVAGRSSGFGTLRAGLPRPSNRRSDSKLQISAALRSGRRTDRGVVRRPGRQSIEGSVAVYEAV
jgi:hypothetical protein